MVFEVDITILHNVIFQSQRHFAAASTCASLHSVNIHLILQYVQCWKLQCTYTWTQLCWRPCHWSSQGCPSGTRTFRCGDTSPWWVNYNTRIIRNVAHAWVIGLHSGFKKFDWLVWKRTWLTCRDTWLGLGGGSQKIWRLEVFCELYSVSLALFWECTCRSQSTEIRVHGKLFLHTSIRALQKTAHACQWYINSWLIANYNRKYKWNNNHNIILEFWFHKYILFDF